MSVQPTYVALKFSLDHRLFVCKLRTSQILILSLLHSFHCAVAIIPILLRGNRCRFDKTHLSSLFYLLHCKRVVAHLEYRSPMR